MAIWESSTETQEHFKKENVLRIPPHEETKDLQVISIFQERCMVWMFDS